MRPVELEDDHFHDECGVFGVFGAPEASNLTYLGLHALQHRGQEAAGIVSTDGKRLYVQRATGLVQDVFTNDVLALLPGDRAVGHVRYSTAGGSHLKNAQPIAVDTKFGAIGVGHNGNLTNADALRTELESAGSIFQTTSDTEVVVHLIARSQAATNAERIAESLRRVEGAFSMLFLTKDEMVAVRDPWGFRPLCLGRTVDGAWVVSSEPPAFELIAARYERDIEPGEMVVVSEYGLRSLRPFEPKPQRACIFEHVYFARPDSKLFGASVYAARKEMGRILSEEHSVDADVVMPVPDSGVSAALGYSEKAGIPFELGLIRSHYVGRTFIEPTQQIRHFGVRLKLSPVRDVIAGKRVIVVDDSIVRGTTSRKIVRLIRDAGAKEVHMRISSPPTRWPCFYGIDTPSRKELIAATQDVDGVKRFVECDTLGYLSVEGLLRAVGGAGGQGTFCDACFTGNYPVPVREVSEGTTRLPILGS